MAGEVHLIDNSAAVLRALEAATARGLEIIGGKAETYAKAKAPNWGGTLRNSITHQVRDGVVTVGSNMEIAAYAELGTSVKFEPPPEWITSEPGEGKHHYGGAGISQWIYFDPLDGEFKVGSAQKAHHFLRDAFEGHFDEYRRVMENELRNA